MAALSDLVSWRDALIEARAQGVELVKHGDRKVRYRSDAEMAAAIRDLDRQIEAAMAAGGTRAPIRVSTSKGA
jgi:DNA-binding IclR family transcriptional regulator